MNSVNFLYSVILDIILYLCKSVSKIGLLINSLWHFKNKSHSSIDDIAILHRGEHYLFVNKHYDVVMNSNNPDDKVTVHTQLKKLVPEFIHPDLGHDFYFVHRLDCATSGVLCICKDKSACQQAAIAFRRRKVDKYYLAIVRGHISKELIEIHLGVAKDRRRNHTYHMTVEGNRYAKNVVSASTRILVLEKGISHGFPATKVLLKPHTGRRHQLRLHLNFLGHTIVGDYTYSNRNDTEPYRMFLHAYRLVLPTELEHHDIQSKDPFIECPKNKWISVQKLNNLDAEAMEKIHTGKPDVIIKKSKISVQKLNNLDVKAMEKISKGKPDVITKQNEISVQKLNNLAREKSNVIIKQNEMSVQKLNNLDVKAMEKISKGKPDVIIKQNEIGVQKLNNLDVEAMKKIHNGKPDVIIKQNGKNKKRLKTISPHREDANLK